MAPHTHGTAAIINPFANEKKKKKKKNKALRGCLTSPKSLHALISVSVIKYLGTKQLRKERFS